MYNIITYIHSYCSLIADCENDDQCQCTVKPQKKKSDDTEEETLAKLKV